MTASLESLMKSAQDGDKKAYHQLLQEAQRLIQRYVTKRVYARAEVGDVVQEILMSLHKARHTYQPDKPFTPWLYAICHFRVQDYLRRTYRSREDAYDNFEGLSHNADDTESIDSTLEKRQLTEQALSLLNDKQRTIIDALYLQELSADEAAIKLDYSVSDIRTSAHRALKKLQSEGQL